jgi:hypothetical protein
MSYKLRTKGIFNKKVLNEEKCCVKNKELSEVKNSQHIEIKEKHKNSSTLIISNHNFTTKTNRNFHRNLMLVIR